MTDGTRPAIMVDLLENHFDELDFLWEQRERSVFDFDYDLPGLAELEERAWAHLEGLKLGGDHTVELVTSHLAADETSAATAAAFTLAALDESRGVQSIMEAFASGSPEARDGIRIALRHLDPGRFLAPLREHSESEDPAVAASAVDVLAFHRIPAVTVPREWLQHEDESMRLRAISAIGRNGSGFLSSDELDAVLATGNRSLHRAALETAARGGMADLAGYCRRAGSRPEDPVPEALAFLGVVGDASDLATLASALGRENLALAALEGLGALGDTRAIPDLIGAMSRPELAHAAGAAFRRITGVDEIDAEAPQSPPEGVSEEEADFLDTTLPPDPERAKEWWEAEEGRFDEKERWQAGLEVSNDPLGESFDLLPLPCRRDIYLRARASDPAGTPDLELELRAGLQLEARRNKKD